MCGFETIGQFSWIATWTLTGGNGEYDVMRMVLGLRESGSRRHDVAKGTRVGKTVALAIATRKG